MTTGPHRTDLESSSYRPPASSAVVQKNMSRQKRRDTDCEMRVRRLLHSAGIRYRVDFRPINEVRSRVDVGWKTLKLAVFIDGCFWHMCPAHFTPPKSNSEWWQKKLETNVERDQRITQALTAHGWTVLRFWEHENPECIARRIVSHRTRLSRHTIQS